MKAEDERVGKRDGKWLRVLGTAVVSTVSGDVLVSSPSLLRFGEFALFDVFVSFTRGELELTSLLDDAFLQSLPGSEISSTISSSRHLSR